MLVDIVAYGGDPWAGEGGTWNAQQTCGWFSAPAGGLVRVPLCEAPAPGPAVGWGPWSPVSLVPPPEVSLGLCWQAPWPPSSPYLRETVSRTRDLSSSAIREVTANPGLPHPQPCSGTAGHSCRVPASLGAARSGFLPPGNSWLDVLCPCSMPGQAFSCWPVSRNQGHLSGQ